MCWAVLAVGLLLLPLVLPLVLPVVPLVVACVLAVGALVAACVVAAGLGLDGGLQAHPPPEGIAGQEVGLGGLGPRRGLRPEGGLALAVPQSLQAGLRVDIPAGAALALGGPAGGAALGRHGQLRGRGLPGCKARSRYSRALPVGEEVD